MRHDGRIVLTLSIIFLAAVSFAGNEISRDQSLVLSLCFFAAFFTYTWIAGLEYQKTWMLLLLGILARISLMFSLPSLSDDFYRFLWDGHLIKSGLNPYQYLPVQIVEQMELAHQELVHSMNSPEYYTVYPPLNQFIFWLSVSLFDDWLLSVNFMRILLLGADIGAFFILRTLLGSEKKHLAFWYFLNPLVILEFVGNVHFEGMVIFFLLLGLYMLSRQRWILSGVAIGMAIATKLIPLIFLPHLGWHNRWKKGSFLVVSALTITILSFLPFFHGDISGISESFGLYFQRFEFNASFYYGLREIGFLQKGYNVIQSLGPELARLSMLLILALAFWGSYRKWKTEMVMLFSLTIYFALSTTIHPWYVLTLIPLGVLSGYRFPVVWSFGIFFTYVGYTASGYETPVFWIFLEYLLVYGVLSYEVWKNNSEKTALV